MSELVKNRRNQWLKVSVAVVMTALFFEFLIIAFQFEDTVTVEDIDYAKKLLNEYTVNPIDSTSGYEEQVNFVKQVQRAVLDYAAPWIPIPENHTRNIKDLYEWKSGLCYDKSHVMEKICRVYGLKTRHISMYIYDKSWQRFFIWMVPFSPSHAVFEVKTKKGWMLVDSITEIVGLTTDNMPLDLYALRELIYEKRIEERIYTNMNYSRRFIFLYGVYSRNGLMYPPYNAIPDYRSDELIYNLCRNF